MDGITITLARDVYLGRLIFTAGQTLHLRDGSNGLCIVTAPGSGAGREVADYVRDALLDAAK